MAKTNKDLPGVTASGQPGTEPNAAAGVASSAAELPTSPEVLEPTSNPPGGGSWRWDSAAPGAWVANEPGPDAA
ncbi:hypothetical protein LNV08_11695 [Paucibacter sp. TC2R-5]|uniref:hypothetical protein n=1 Tax=Paucibacter sp. TC2R-5 TaxID=2893555 RepID=UPI0021E3E165|nr:hypothetical protein [Paucibacter sp. TC2R-5]MCV2359632.1 hypothetical protein [Paucibacter sp. TC2R-5]